MGLISVWESETDGKLFKDKQKYVSHLRKLAALKREEAKRVAYRKERDAFFANMRATCKNMDEVLAFVKANWERFYLNGLTNDSRSIRRKAKGVPALEWIKMKEAAIYSDRVSNSHAAPIGAITNWGGNNNGPRGYPGWTFRFDYQVEGGNATGCSSEAWTYTGINTGTGGCGGSYYYYCEIFAHDWPAMYEEEMRNAWIKKENDERQLAWRKIGGNPGQIPVVTKADMPEDWVPPALPALYTYEDQKNAKKVPA